MEPIGISVFAEDRPGLMRDVTACVAEANGNIEGLHLLAGVQTEIHLEIVGDVDKRSLLDELAEIPQVMRVVLTDSAK